jgi:hypothetical protein
MFPTLWESNGVAVWASKARKPMLAPFATRHGFRRGGTLRIGTALVLVLITSLIGCSRRQKEIAEGLSLARLLRRLAPEATDLMRQEQASANELRINLEESGNNDFSAFRESLRKSVETLSAVRDRRLELQRQVHQGNFDTPLVIVVQRDAEQEFQNQVTRTQTWIQLAQNVRLRADLGRMKTFPEVQVLTHQLLLFLSEAQDEPLSDQIQTLKNEYRFTDNEIGT